MGRTSEAKERLVNSASELIYARGYQGVGIEDLCRQAKVKKGSFYYFFRSKRDLALAALDLRWRLAREHMIDPVFHTRIPPLERVRRLFDALADESATEKDRRGHCRGCAFGNLSAEMSSHDEKIRQRVRQIFEDLTGYVKRALEEAVARGDVEGINPAENARAIVAYSEGLLLLARTYNDPSIVRQLGYRAVHLAAARSAPSFQAGEKEERP